MMFSSEDLKHIETEILQTLLPSESSNSVFLDPIETPTDLYRRTIKRNSQRFQTLQQLEQLWENGSENPPKKGQKRPETT
ncbi:MAG: hypothetical protein AAGF93_22380 [Cyanobacteria bacterium P01_H01_bin.105]